MTPTQGIAAAPACIHPDDPLIGPSFNIMSTALYNMHRECGDPASTHTLRMVGMMERFQLGPAFICACLLHELPRICKCQIRNGLPVGDSNPLKPIRSLAALRLVELYDFSRHGDKRRQGQRIYEGCQHDYRVAFLLGAEIASDCPTLSALKDPTRELRYIFKIMGQFQLWLPYWRSSVPIEQQFNFDLLWKECLAKANIELSRLLPLCPKSQMRLDVYTQRCEAYIESYFHQ